MSSTSNSRRLGIALDATHLAIAWRDGDARHSRWESIASPCDGSPDSVTAALAELTAKAPAVSAANMTLVRPIAHTRALRLPRMAQVTLEGVLARDGSRHIIGHRTTPHTVSARLADRGSWLAAFAPTDLLEKITEHARSRWWPDVDIRTSDDTLAGAACALAPQEARGGDCFVVLCDAAGPTDAVHLRGGMPWRGRRFLPGAAEADIAAFTHASNAVASAPIVLLGHATRSANAAQVLGAQGIRTRAIDLGLAPSASTVEMLAAAGTIAEARLPLRSPSAQRMHVLRMRATTRWLAIAAVVALIVALGLDRWRVQRELAVVRRARTDVSTPVRNAVAARGDLENATDVAEALAERESGASRVSGALAAVAVALPSGASLTVIHVAGDSLTIEGESIRSAAVYDALRTVSMFEHIKLAAPLRQERQAGDVAVEHFAFSARLRGASGPVRGANP